MFSRNSYLILDYLKTDEFHIQESEIMTAAYYYFLILMNFLICT